MQAFRFFALPPELRNRIYEDSFSDTHGLSPPGITQANQRAREESLKLFYVTTKVLEIPVSTAPQMTCFLKWLSESKYRPLRTAQSLGFTYLNPLTGATTIRLTREELVPGQLVAEQALKEQQANSNPPLAGTTVPLPRLAQQAWHYSLGLPLVAHMSACRSYVTKLRTPSTRFTTALQNNGPWTSYQILVVAEKPEAYFCYCIEPYSFLMKLVKRLDGREMEDTHLREVAFYLFRLSLQAENLQTQGGWDEVTA